MRLFTITFLCWANIIFALPHFSLVESVPIGTIYTQSQLPRTENVWLAMINHAKRQIDIGAFYVNSVPYSSMATIIDALNASAKRGVSVNILLDKTFAKQSATTITLFNSHIHVRYINIKLLSHGVMHAKYMIVDQQQVFVGSQNFDWKAISQNHEIGVYVNNAKLATQIAQVFHLDWQLATVDNRHQAWHIVDHWPNRLSSTPTHIGSAFITPAFSPKSLTPKTWQWELSTLLSLISHAKQHIFIQVYQYSDIRYSRRHKKWTRLNHALIAAAKRGVKVYLIVSDVMLHNRGLADLRKLAQHKNIFIKMSHVPLYHGKHIAYGRVEHAKYMEIDNNICWIGTGNWSDDYFYSSRNITLIVTDKKCAEQLQTIFRHDWLGPYVKNI